MAIQINKKFYNKFLSTHNDKQQTPKLSRPTLTTPQIGTISRTMYN